MGTLGNINTKFYSNRVELLQDNLIRFHRVHSWEVDSEQIDTFSRFWSLAFIDCNISKISVLHNGQEINLIGKQVIFIPSFSLVKWKIKSADLKWVGYFSDTPISDIGFYEPIAFKWIDEHLPNSILEIRTLLKSANDVRPIGVNTNDILAKKLKHFIDKNYCNSISLQEIASQFGYSKECLIRHFKKILWNFSNSIQN